jgi:hypothetical protein
MIKVKISELPGKSVKIERLENGKWKTDIYEADFYARFGSTPELVSVNMEDKPFVAISVRAEEIKVNGEVLPSAEEAVSALNAFIGNFRAGGSSPSTTDITLSITKSGINGEVTPSIFSWTDNLAVKEVILMSNAAGISLQTGGEEYDEASIIGVELPAGAELAVTDVEIAAGENLANAIIIFKKN